MAKHKFSVVIEFTSNKEIPTKAQKWVANKIYDKAFAGMLLDDYLEEFDVTKTDVKTTNDKAKASHEEPNITKFSIRQTGETEGEYTVYDIDVNTDVVDGVDAAKLLLNDLIHDSRVVKMLSSVSNVDVILVNGLEVDKDQLMEDMAVAAKEGVEIVEITSTPAPSRDKISDAWVDGLEYKGLNVFSTVYEDQNNQSILDEEVKGLNVMVDATKDNFEVQECYLGYSPSKDEFIMGYDGWYTVVEEDEEGEEVEENDNCSPYIVFKLVDGKVNVIEDLHIS